MLKPLKIPRGIANVFAIGSSTVIQIDERYKYRPDKILGAIGAKSISKEIVNNYLSNTSPITCDENVEYVIADELINGYFVRG